MSRKFVYYGAGKSADELLLDLYPGTVGYSLRKLRTAYTGAAIRVRRSSDNTEQDIGFSGNDLDTASLLSFVGSGDGFVTILYDQMVNHNATQTTASIQPLIVSSGSLITTSTEPAIKFSAAQFLNLDTLATSLSGALTDRTSYVVSKFDDTSDRIVFSFGNSSNDQPFQSYSRNNSAERTTFRSDSQVSLALGGISANTNQHLSTSAWRNDGYAKYYYNGIFTSDGLKSNFNDFPIDRGAIGCLPRTGNALFHNGTVQEILLYNNFELNRTDIESNQIAKYGI